MGKSEEAKIVSSTPQFPKARPTIREKKLENTASSPIGNGEISSDESFSEDVKSISADTPTKRDNKNVERTKGANLKKTCASSLFSSWKFVGLLSPFVVGLSILAYTHFNAMECSAKDQCANRFDFDTIQHKFPSNELLFVSLNASLEDIITNNRPSTLMLLYDGQSSSVLNDILNYIIQNAPCALCKSTSHSHMMITADDLNLEEFKSDYGNLLEYYRGPLQQTSVMVIHNLELVDSRSAQAFHYICDQYNPLVPHALIIFTIDMRTVGVNADSTDHMNALENYFQNKWSDLKYDIFQALYTRISSLPLIINSVR